MTFMILSINSETVPPLATRWRWFPPPFYGFCWNKRKAGIQVRIWSIKLDQVSRTPSFHVVHVSISIFKEKVRDFYRFFCGIVSSFAYESSPLKKLQMSSDWLWGNEMNESVVSVTAFTTSRSEARCRRLWSGNEQHFHHFFCSENCQLLIGWSRVTWSEILNFVAKCSVL